MIRAATCALLRRFRRENDAVVTVEFALLMPLYLLLLISTVELGLVNLRHSQLERALDIAVREVRLNTGAVKDHDTMRDTICDLSGLIDNCESSLRLEMIQLDPFAWAAPDPEPDCISDPEVINSPREFNRSGNSNDLMLIRACMRFKPIFSSWGLGEDLANADGAGLGLVSLVATSAFVQEPQ
ncbi:TadE/TadG family type IV pilus assembly protein [Phaeobacter sp. 11ANDIMAR09]|uniref:TadE/TadG family type IV pilus assembly protein n=1 Tax=Phaeobacter sp. 11ANDIMAR09 TaxID=1225647 RepID=UPI0006C86A83|nr:TadE/TadG family type IV pilus assembly protein [Phaeobacter sp. 11ANDIMAR09]KPD12718.1 pilus assembly protein TadE [Phaeobacter sp. 11ANDIMAR09]